MDIFIKFGKYKNENIINILRKDIKYIKRIINKKVKDENKKNKDMIGKIFLELELHNGGQITKLTDKDIKFIENIKLKFLDKNKLTIKEFNEEKYYKSSCPCCLDDLYIIKKQFKKNKNYRKNKNYLSLNCCNNYICKCCLNKMLCNHLFKCPLCRKELDKNILLTKSKKDEKIIKELFESYILTEIREDFELELQEEIIDWNNNNEEFVESDIIHYFNKLKENYVKMFNYFHIEEEKTAFFHIMKKILILTTKNCGRCIEILYILEKNNYFMSPKLISINKNYY